MNGLRLPLCLLICLVVCGIGPEQTHAQQAFIDQVPGLKAGSLVLFGYYFKWPADAVPGDDFVIGLVGEAPFGSERVTARFKKVGNKNIRVLEFDSAKDYQPCHILFVADAAAPASAETAALDRLVAALEKINDGPVLVVTETPGFAMRGAMVNFVVDEVANRLKTEVNLVTLKKAKLNVTKHFVPYSKTNKCILVKADNGGLQGAGG